MDTKSPLGSLYSYLASYYSYSYSYCSQLLTTYIAIYQLYSQLFQLLISYIAIQPPSHYIPSYCSYLLQLQLKLGNYIAIVSLANCITRSFRNHAHSNGWRQTMAVNCLQNHCSDCYAWVVCSCSAESKICMTICQCILRNKIINYI